MNYYKKIQTINEALEILYSSQFKIESQDHAVCYTKCNTFA